MKLMTRNSVMVCPHEVGIVGLIQTQRLVTIDGVPVLVEIDPEGRPIVGCPNMVVPAGIKPCLFTLKVTAGYSDFLRIDGRRACLDSVTGFTDGTPPGVHKYHVRDPGQAWVEQRP